ncbi:hypothetical protein MPL3356_340040 [Mesorhizobium plurifarium]|uniref:Uncharacterized protein n=1 Tax=Mesorhizobium plurifarium TaxID=69974 RepID=A0A090E232_MESPL|nr:hypothetical protein MPL3356_340040 [Mesorhizobium plurifarium]
MRRQSSSVAGAIGRTKLSSMPAFKRSRCWFSAPGAIRAITGRPPVRGSLLNVAQILEPVALAGPQSSTTAWSSRSSAAAIASFTPPAGSLVNPSTPRMWLRNKYNSASCEQISTNGFIGATPRSKSASTASVGWAGHGISSTPGMIPLLDNRVHHARATSG